MAATARRRPNPQGDSSTRDRILEVALEAFSQLGFEGASTPRISTQSGVNQGLIPYYFGSKEKLWKEAVDRAFEELGMGVDAARGATLQEEATPRQQIERVIHEFVAFVARRPEFARLMNEEGSRDGSPMRWIVDRHVRPLYEAIGDLVDRSGVPTRLPTGLDPAHFFYILVGAATQLFHQSPEFERLTGKDPRDPEVIEAHAEALIALLLGPTS